MVDYEHHLDRAIQETPDVAEGSARFSVPDPDVRPEGNVTVYENFRETLDRLDREGTHVLQFLQSQLGTSAHIDESGRARLTGEFALSRIADALETYVETYVVCPECGLPDTRLETEHDVLVLRCEACGARSLVDG